MEKKKLKLFLMNIPLLFLVSCDGLFVQPTPVDTMLSKEGTCGDMGADKNEGVFGYFATASGGDLVAAYNCKLPNGDHVTVLSPEECTSFSEIPPGSSVSSSAQNPEIRTGTVEGDLLGYVYKNYKQDTGTIPAYRCLFSDVPGGEHTMFRTKEDCTNNKGVVKDNAPYFYMFPTPLSGTRPIYQCNSVHTGGMGTEPGTPEDCNTLRATGPLHDTSFGLGDFSITWQSDTNIVVYANRYVAGGELKFGDELKGYKKQSSDTGNVYYFINPVNGKQYLVTVKLESCSINNAVNLREEDTQQCQLKNSGEECPNEYYIKNFYKEKEGTTKKILCCKETIDTDLRTTYLSQQ